MGYVVDLDPTHSVIRITVTAEIVTPELAEDIRIRFERVASSGGPFAAIIDASRVTSWTEPAAAIRDAAFRDPAVPGGRAHVTVAREPSVFGLARMFQLCRDFFGEQYQVVQSLGEAYEVAGVRPEDFTQRIFPIDVGA
jgi:hypothetical protein